MYARPQGAGRLPEILRHATTVRDDDHTKQIRLATTMESGQGRSAVQFPGPYGTGLTGQLGQVRCLQDLWCSALMPGRSASRCLRI